MKILMLCLGNICRSPLAEGILQNLARVNGLQWEVDSAGTNGYHNGEAPHHLSQKVAKKYGIDISMQCSRKFTAEDFNTYDIIYAMAADVMADIQQISGKAFDSKKVKLFLNEHTHLQNQDVPDPWFGAEDGYENTFAIINETCAMITERYASKEPIKTL